MNTERKPTPIDRGLPKTLSEWEVEEERRILRHLAEERRANARRIARKARQRGWEELDANYYGALVRAENRFAEDVALVARFTPGMTREEFESEKKRAGTVVKGQDDAVTVFNARSAHARVQERDERYEALSRFSFDSAELAAAFEEAKRKRIATIAAAQRALDTAQGKTVISAQQSGNELEVEEQL